MWKISGTIAWTIDDDGVFTSIGVSGISGEQAHNLPYQGPGNPDNPNQTVPIRSIDHP